MCIFLFSCFLLQPKSEIKYTNRSSYAAVLIWQCKFYSVCRRFWKSESFCQSSPASTTRKQSQRTYSRECSGTVLSGKFQSKSTQLWTVHNPISFPFFFQLTEISVICLFWSRNFQLNGSHFVNSLIGIFTPRKFPVPEFPEGWPNGQRYFA